MEVSVILRPGHSSALALLPCDGVDREESLAFGSRSVARRSRWTQAADLDDPTLPLVVAPERSASHRFVAACSVSHGGW